MAASLVASSTVTSVTGCVVISGIAQIGNAERGVLRHISGRNSHGPCPGWRQAIADQCGGVHLDTIGDFLTVRPPLGQRVAVKSCVFVAGVVLMFARTSPALAADNHQNSHKA